MPFRSERTLKFFALLLPFSLFICGVCWPLSLRDEKRIGEELYRKLSKKLHFVSDPLIGLYVREVGQRIVEASGDRRFRYRFFVIEGNQPNAFTIPGGYVFVNTALLNMVSSEDELAGVLAHEVSHSVLRHVSRMFEGARRVSLASLAALVAGMLLAKEPKAQGAIAAGTAAMAHSLILKYSRDHEFEADQLSLKILQKAGYSPQGLVSFLRKIYRWSKTISVEVPVYLSTHPAIPSRIAYLEAHAGSHPPTETLALKRIKARLRLMQRDPEEVLRELHRGEDLGVDELYLLALALIRKGNHREAMEALKKMLVLSPGDPYAQRELALLLISLKEFDSAEGFLEGALRAFPRDPELVLAKVNALLFEGKTEEAIAFCRTAVEKVPQEAFLYKVLGELFRKAGNEVLSHENFGLYFMKEGDREAALYHFQKALELSRGEERERIRRRIEALKGS
ncbi:MAG: hypothetical protein DRG31_07065 [Deltaproteobacteria bacterium]|nr:MAG: hypothetical protein DRG31_07065 [Deltaproteobacteria bacterium]